MIFKNINPYQLSRRIDYQALANLLSEKEFISCLPSQESSAGFARISDGTGFLISANDVHLFCLKLEEKSVPPSVVNELYKKLLAKENESGNTLTGTERSELKASARQSLLPKTFGKISRVWAYVDNRNHTLIINTSSPKVADGLASTIRNRFSSLDVKPFRPDADVSKILTDWMLTGLAPAPFTLGRKCEINDGSGTIKYTNRNLDDDQLRKYLQNDMSLISVGLSYDERCDFLLSTDFVIKEIEYGNLSHNVPDWLDGAESEFERQLVHMADLIRECLNQLKSTIENKS